MRKIFLLLVLSIFVMIIIYGCTKHENYNQSRSSIHNENQVEVTSLVDATTLTETTVPSLQPVVPETSVLATEDTTTNAPAVIKSGTITTFHHDAAGVVTITNDGVLTIDHFSYDGDAPDAYITIGSFENGKFKQSENVSLKLNRAYLDETISISLRSDLDLSAIQGVSVWCDAYEEDFGSLNFEESDM